MKARVKLYVKYVELLVVTDNPKPYRQRNRIVKFVSFAMMEAVKALKSLPGCRYGQPPCDTSLAAATMVGPGLSLQNF